MKSESNTQNRCPKTKINQEDYLDEDAFSSTNRNNTPNKQQRLLYLSITCIFCVRRANADNKQ